MYRLVQPAMQGGVGAARPRPDEPEDDWDEHRVLTRSWAATRLVLLVLACGIGVAAVIAIFVAVIATLVGNI
jgi:uncharacterized protein involved in exopolysaccharide biosynthesis